MGVCAGVISLGIMRFMGDSPSRGSSEQEVVNMFLKVNMLIINFPHHRVLGAEMQALIPTKDVYNSFHCLIHSTAQKPDRSTGT